MSIIDIISPKKIFWCSMGCFILFELVNVYFIMPLPGSQKLNSLDLAYFLFRWRWTFRVLFSLGMILGAAKSNWKNRWVPLVLLCILVAVIYFSNYFMAADHTFYQPTHITFRTAASNQVDSNRLVIGVVHQGIAKAYPIQFIGYHHQVTDSLGGIPILVTYCTVCRTGRVYKPIVNGRHETFRLVGMDHFNAMLEDGTTKSWWRQATGEAVIGPLKGHQLPEVFSQQYSLSEWIKIYPNTLILQADGSFIDQYSTTTDYETGKSRKKLTGTDSLSWKPKSWVVGVRAGIHTKAYDWSRLKTERIIHDQIKGLPVLIVMNKDSVGFFAFQRPDATSRFSLNQNILTWGHHRFSIYGDGLDTNLVLKKLPAYQEFWHSWKYFNPGTEW